MSKYIELKEAIDRFLPMGSDIPKDQVIYILNRIPTENIVYCKDCRYNIDNLYSHYDEGEVVCYIWCEVFRRDPNNFCSFGKSDKE